MKKIKEEKKIKRIIRQCTWVIERTEYDDGTVTVKRTNTGFNGHELLGMIEEIKTDVLLQFRGLVKVNEIQRDFKS